MKFHLLDRVHELAGDRIVASKNVTLAEEYLGDHFPTFPVLPGVLMLEAATQAAAWLAFHESGLLDDPYDGPTIAVLKSARNVRYGSFVAPGRALVVTATAGGDLKYNVEGKVDDKIAFTGKLALAALRVPSHDAANAKLVAAHRARWAALTAAGSPALALA